MLRDKLKKNVARITGPLAFMTYTKKQQSRIKNVYFNELPYITVLCITLNNFLINY